MFTTTECMKLTGLNRNQLAHLQRIELVVPTRVSTRLNVYSWTQLKELRVIAELRKNLSLQQIREASEFISDLNYDDNFLYTKKLVVFKNGLTLIENTDDSSALTISGKYKGQRVLNVFSCNKIIDDLIKVGRENVAYFDSKTKIAEMVA